MRVAFLGDTMLGGRVDDLLERRGHGYTLRRLRPALEGADFVVANLEGPVTTGGTPADKPDRPEVAKRFWHRMDPRALRALRRAGVRVVSLANNHMLDFGEQGLLDTVEHLDRARIRHTGAGRDLAAARRPAVIRRGGIRIGFWAAMQRYRMYVEEDGYARSAKPGPVLLKSERAQRDIAHLRDRVDVVVAMPHWGRNYRPVSDLQRDLARDLTAAGAAIVIGHHPHIVQEVELVGGRPVLYSLGNAAFGFRGRYEERGCPPYGMVATAEIQPPGRLGAVEVQLIDQLHERIKYRPRPADSDEAQALLGELVSVQLDWRELGPAHLRAELR